MQATYVLEAKCNRNVNMQNIPFYKSTFWIFTICVFSILILPTLVQEGMFMDAVIYTSVAKNLSQDIGTFWHPYFDPVNVFGHTSFHEQPPLVFGLVSIFFKVFGDSIYTERIYVLFTAIVNLLLIQYLWKILFENQSSYRKLNWLPVLLWISIPVCFWSFSNNMNENTMSIFVLLSVIYIFKAIHYNTKVFAHIFIGAMCIVLAFLCKGFPALFPISIPFWYWISFKKHTFFVMCKHTFMLLVIICIIAFALYLYPPSSSSLSTYLIDRALYRIQNAPSVDSRFFILTRLLSELLPILILTILLVLIANKVKIVFINEEHKKLIKLFLYISLSGTLPLMLTKVQNGFYMVATLPYWGIFFALVLSNSFLFITNKMSISFTKKILLLNYILLPLILLYSFSRIGGTFRDKDILHDIKLIGNSIPKYSVCFTPHYNEYINTAIHPYFVRYYNIYLSNIDTCNYVLTNKDYLYKKANKYTSQIDNLTYFNFYKKVKFTP